MTHGWDADEGQRSQSGGGGKAKRMTARNTAVHVLLIRQVVLPVLGCKLDNMTEPNSKQLHRRAQHYGDRRHAPCHVNSTGMV